MITLDTIRKPVTAELEAFDEFVDRQFTAEGELLADMLRYALSSRGKGIRPLLVMLSAAMNSPVEGAAKGRRVHLAAMLVEMIHVASLIHDDVIDESDTRRGRPSANARWQSHKAVILGDFILARNMNIGLSSGQFDLVTHVCGSMAALCEGEALKPGIRAEQVPEPLLRFACYVAVSYKVYGMDFQYLDTNYLFGLVEKVRPDMVKKLRENGTGRLPLNLQKRKTEHFTASANDAFAVIRITARDNTEECCREVLNYLCELLEQEDFPRSYAVEFKGPEKRYLPITGLPKKKALLPNNEVFAAKK